MGGVKTTQRFVVFLPALCLLVVGCTSSRPAQVRTVRLPPPRPRPKPLPRPQMPPVARPQPPAGPVAMGLPADVMPPGGLTRRWDYIVIHHSATKVGGAERFDRMHTKTNGWDEMGYHFVIGNGSDTADGQIEIGGRWYKQKHGAHCKTPDNYFNDHGIGICLVGDFENGGRPTPEQMWSLERLVRYLSKTCQVPVKRVATHGAITHKTQCPGKRFPIAKLKGRLQESLAMSESVDPEPASEALSKPHLLVSR